MRFDAVLFDCDGVLVDSEPITNGVLRQMLNEAGWPLTQAECERIFIGKAVRDERVRIEAETGAPLTEDWMRAFYERRNQRLMAELQAVAGALDAVVAAHRHTAGRIACASGADRPKVVMQIGMAGMAPYFEDRIFSGHDLPRSKPHPDVYLAAAAHLGVNPARCLVVEDTATGVQAGLAAGATVWGYCQHGDGRAFQGLPVARVMHHMGELAQHLGALR
jgi:HAD superfamily hydrolase (TIGR01509 family)